MSVAVCQPDLQERGGPREEEMPQRKKKGSGSPSKSSGKGSKKKGSKKGGGVKDKKLPPDPLSPAAMLNAYYISHGAVEFLAFRGYKWEGAATGKKKKKK